MAALAMLLVLCAAVLVSGQRGPKPNNGLSLYGMRRLPKNVEVEVVHAMVPMRDGVKLNVVIFLPETRTKPRSASVSRVELVLYIHEV